MNPALCSRYVLLFLTACFACLIARSASAQEVCYKLRDALDRNVKDSPRFVRGELISAQAEKDKVTLSILQAFGRETTIDNVSYELCERPFSMCAEGQDRVEGDIIGKQGNEITISNSVVTQEKVRMPPWQVCPPRDCATNPDKPGCAATPAKPQTAGAPQPAQTVPQPVPAPAASTTEKLVFTGSGTVGYGPLPVLIEAYAKANGVAEVRKQTFERTIIYDLQRKNEAVPFLSITVNSFGSETALGALVRREADIGMSSRDLLGIPPMDAPDAEKLKREAIDNAALLQRLSGGKSREEIETVLALDGVVFLVNRENPVRSLNLCEAARAFGGEPVTWTQLGAQGLGNPLIVARNSESGTVETFRELVLRNCGKREIAASADVRKTPQEVFAVIARNRAALGFMGRGIVPDSVKEVGIQGGCGIESRGSRFEIKTEDYPLSRRLFLYMPYRLGPQARDFLKFINTNDTVQKSLAGSQAVDQLIEKATGEDRARNEARVQGVSSTSPQERADGVALARAVEGKIRLSITFRFETDGAVLDAKALEDIKRLVNYFFVNPTRTTVLIAGFADGRGSYEYNKRLSQQRADAVKAALLAGKANVSPAKLDAIGFGKIAPVACNTNTYLELSRNRRVEIWIGNE
jgi:phosphate transport system substrate-binding protein